MKDINKEGLKKLEVIDEPSEPTPKWAMALGVIAMTLACCISLLIAVISIILLIKGIKAIL